MTQRAQKDCQEISIYLLYCFLRPLRILRVLCVQKPAPAFKATP